MDPTSWTINENFTVIGEHRPSKEVANDLSNKIQEFEIFITSVEPKIVSPHYVYIIKFWILIKGAKIDEGRISKHYNQIAFSM